MDLRLEGRVALVTGGSRGIGKAVAARLAQEGVDVAISGRDAARASGVAAEIAESTGRRVVALTAEMGDEAAVRRLVAEATDALGPITILVNNAATAAGRARPPQLAEITRAAFLTEIDIKVLGYLFAAQACAPAIADAGWGRIINIAGLAARNTGSVIGSVRNIAVAAMTKNLGDELGPKGINVTCVHPGMTRTRTLDEAADEQERAMLAAIEDRIPKMNTVRRMIDADDIATIVTFLASPLSVAINGDAIVCGGGTPGPIFY